MALKKVSNGDASLTVSGASVTGAAIITSVPSIKVKVMGKGVYRGGVGFQITAATRLTCVGTPPINGTISPTAVKTKADAQEVIRDGDDETVTVNGIDSGTGLACSFSATVTINAGQDKVKAD